MAVVLPRITIRYLIKRSPRNRLNLTAYQSRGGFGQSVPESAVSLAGRSFPLVATGGLYSDLEGVRSELGRTTGVIRQGLSICSKALVLEIVTSDSVC